MGRLTLIALIVFDTVAFAQDTPFAHELQSIGEANSQVKRDVQDALRQGDASDYRDFASQLAEVLAPMLWSHELSGPDRAAQASLDGLVRLANAARELSEHAAKYDEVVSINDEVQALIFQARFAIRGAERNARLAGRLGTRDERAAQDAADAERQSANHDAASQRRDAADGAHQRRMQASQRAARNARERQNAENARTQARATRANRFRRVAGIAATAAASRPRARPARARPHHRPRGTRVTHRQTTTVQTSPGRTRTTTRSVTRRTR